MFEVGRVCVKLAGRDAGKKCIIIDTLDYPYVLIDGETRRKKTNVNHLHPLSQTVKVDKGASHESLAGACKEAGFELRNTKAKEAKPKPKAQRKVRPKVAKKKAAPVKEATIVKEEKAAPKKKAAKKKVAEKKEDTPKAQ